MHVVSLFQVEMTVWFDYFLILLTAVSFVSAKQRLRHDAFQHTLGHLKVQSSPNVQSEAVKNLSERLLGEYAKLFSLSVDPKAGPIGKDTFEISKNVLGHIEIVGTSGVAAAWGLHYYLKHYCNCHIAWEGSQIELPNTLPNVHVAITSNDRFRYYQNVCTAGYSTAWWQWYHWERHIDWMALNGINLALAFHGQEAIWTKVYHEMNLTKKEISEHLGGPAFLPWTRMGNIRGWGGPLFPAWHSRTVRLQHQILRRMRELGIVPVLPAFAGHVPRAFGRLFPSANLTKVDPWNKFADEYCCPYLLNPKDPLFEIVGTKFLKTYIDEFGTNHVYNCDVFNENEPLSSELSYLNNVAHAVYSAMLNVDPNAVWLMQGWLFVHDMDFWTEPRIQTFITSVPIGRMVVLDLQSEQFPQYERLKSYYGQPFIWCMLHNFGGTLGMFGSAEIINKRVFEGRNMNSSTMVGTGLTPEGIHQNYVIYELMNEMAYRREPVDLVVWFQTYATRRYGAWNEYAVDAWQKLRETIYNYVGMQKIRGHYVITMRPSLKIVPWTWYDREVALSAWDMLLRARHGRRNSTLYQHDVVDLTRQALQLTADVLYENIVNAYSQKNITFYRSNAALLLELFDDLERILASGKDFLLGTWLWNAKVVATNQKERESYEYNARNQITLWGPNGEIRDYGNKQWSGVVADYFKPRWSIFLVALENALVNGTRFNRTEVDRMIFESVEQPFTFSTKIYKTIPRGDSVDIAMELNKKWRKIESQSRRSRSIRLFRELEYNEYA